MRQQLSGRTTREQTARTVNSCDSLASAENTTCSRRSGPDPPAGPTTNYPTGPSCGSAPPDTATPDHRAADCTSHDGTPTRLYRRAPSHPKRPPAHPNAASPCPPAKTAGPNKPPDDTTPNDNATNAPSTKTHHRSDEQDASPPCAGTDLRNPHRQCSPHPPRRFDYRVR
jgi:hypothetical protein